MSIGIHFGFSTTTITIIPLKKLVGVYTGQVGPGLTQPVTQTNQFHMSFDRAGFVDIFLPNSNQTNLSKSESVWVGTLGHMIVKIKKKEKKMFQLQANTQPTQQPNATQPNNRNNYRRLEGAHLESCIQTLVAHCGATGHYCSLWQAEATHPKISSSCQFQQDRNSMVREGNQIWTMMHSGCWHSGNAIETMTGQRDGDNDRMIIDTSVLVYSSEAASGVRDRREHGGVMDRRWLSFFQKEKQNRNTTA